MAGQRVRSDKVPEFEGPTLSMCKKAGNHVYISGQSALGFDQNTLGGNDAYEQAKITFGYIQALMEAAGGTIDDVVKITMFTTDMRHQPEIWRARAEFFSGDFPCSTLLCISQLFKPDLLIEIEAVGYIEG